MTVLGAVLDHGPEALEAACAEALEAQHCLSDVMLSALACEHQEPSRLSIENSEALALKAPSVADCARYESLRRVA